MFNESAIFPHSARFFDFGRRREDVVGGRVSKRPRQGGFMEPGTTSRYDLRVRPPGDTESRTMRSTQRYKKEHCRTAVCRPLKQSGCPICQGSTAWLTESRHAIRFARRHMQSTAHRKRRRALERFWAQCDSRHPPRFSGRRQRINHTTHCNSRPAPVPQSHRLRIFYSV